MRSILYRRKQRACPRARGRYCFALARHSHVRCGCEQALCLANNQDGTDHDLPACRTTGQPAAAHLAGLRHRERTMVRRMCWIRRPRKRVLRSAPWIVPAMSKISGDRVTIWPGSRWSLTRNSAGARSVACEGRHRDSRWAAFVEAQLNACRAAKR